LFSNRITENNDWLSANRKKNVVPQSEQYNEIYNSIFMYGYHGNEKLENKAEIDEKAEFTRSK